MQIFNEIRKVLLDPTPEGAKKRAEAEESAGVAKLGSGLLMGFCGAITVVSLIASRHYPVIGGFFTLVSGAGTLLTHEVWAVSHNTEKTMGSAMSRTAAAWKPELFTAKMTEGTWVIKPLFSSMIIRELNKPEKSI